MGGYTLVHTHHGRLVHPLYTPREASTPFIHTQGRGLSLLPEEREGTLRRELSLFLRFNVKRLLRTLEGASLLLGYIPVSLLGLEECTLYSGFNPGLRRGFLLPCVIPVYSRFTVGGPLSALLSAVFTPFGRKARSGVPARIHFSERARISRNNSGITVNNEQEEASSPCIA